MKKSICAFLCVALLVPFILIPASAADDEYDGKFGLAGAVASGSVLPEVKFALYEDKFIYGGVEYPLINHIGDHNTPYFAIAPNERDLLIVMTPFTLNEIPNEYIGIGFSCSVDNIYTFSCEAELPISVYHFTYDYDNSLVFYGYYRVTNSYSFSVPVSSYSQLKTSILCNRFPIFFKYESADPFVMFDTRIVVGDKANPLASDGFFYLNDGTWSDPNFHGSRDVYYSNLSGNWDWDHGFTYDEDASAVMMQVSSDLVDVLWFQSKDGNGNPVTPLISVSSRYHSLSGDDRYFYGLNIVFSTSKFPNASMPYMIQRLRISYADDGSVSGLTKVQESSGRGSLSMYPIDYCYDLDQFLGNVVLCTRFPIYLFDSSTVGFWENPRGHNCDPNYKPVPPLDMLLPQFSGGLNVTPDEFNSIFSSYFSGFTFMTAVFNIFLSVTPIRSILTISFGVGLILFVLNVVPSVASSISSSISRHNAKGDRSDNSSRHNSSRRKR